VIAAVFLSLLVSVLTSIVTPSFAAEHSAMQLPWPGWMLLPVLLALAVVCYLFFKKTREINRLNQNNANLLEQISDIFLRIDSQGKIVALNQRAVDFFTCPRQQLMGQSLEPVSSALPFDLDIVHQALKDQKERHLDKLFDAHHDRIWTVKISPAFHQTRPTICILMKDITEGVQMESLIIKKDKLATLSRVTTSMIHEINNPLASILQNMQLLHNRLNPQLQKNRLAADNCGISMEKMEEYLRQRKVDKAIAAVRESARRAARVIENLILFSTQDVEKEAFHSVSTLLERAIELAAGDFDLKQQYDFRHITLARNYDPALPTLRCHGLKLQQAFFALLRFRAEQILRTNAPENAQMTLSLESGDNQIHLRIEDNGVPVPQTELIELFRPGLRKPNEGLGLCASFFIINKIHGGTLSSEINSDGHSLLIIELPLERLVDG